jgi:hypothetical protein
VKDERPPEFEAQGARFDLALSAFGQEDRSHRARPLTRGKFAFGDLHLRAAPWA